MICYRYLLYTLIFCFLLVLFPFEVLNYPNECTVECLSSNRTILSEQTLSLVSCHTGNELETTKDPTFDPVTQNCDVGIFPIFETSFSLKSLQLLEDDNKLWIQILWNIPKVGGDHRNSPRFWMLKLVVSYPSENTWTWYHFNFSFESLLHLQGNFNFPCVQFVQPHLKLIKLSSTYLIGERSSQCMKILHSQEIKILEGLSVDTIYYFGKTNFSSFINRGVLWFSFSPSPANWDISYYEGSLHKVIKKDICNRNSFSVYKWPKENISPASHLNFSTGNFETYERYCLIVTSMYSNDGNCSQGCSIAKLTDTFYIQTPAIVPLDPKCQNWNADLLVQTSPNEIAVSFSVCCGFDHCFKTFGMYVCKLQENDCNGYVSYVAYEQFEKNANGRNIFKFKILKPGNYCVKVLPIHKECITNINMCSVINSNISQIDSYNSDISSVPVLEKSSHHQVALISGITVLVTVLLIGIAGVTCWRLKLCYFATISPVPPDCVSISGNLESSKEMLLLRNIRIFILYTHDNGTKKCVMELVDFLRRFRNFDVDVDEQQRALLMANGEAWMIKQISYQCLNMGDTDLQDRYRKIIVVESDRAAAHQKYQSHCVAGDSMPNEIQSFEELHKDMDDCDIPLEDLFVYGLTCLTANLKRSLEDYCHLFVVRFEDITRPETRLHGLVPNKRYSLPLHLKELCADLNIPHQEH